jgi:hypothetical protein
MCIQAYQIPMAGSPRGLNPMMQGITRQRGRDSDGNRNARRPSQNPADVRQRSVTSVQVTAAREKESGWLLRQKQAGSKLEYHADCIGRF